MVVANIEVPVSKITDQIQVLVRILRVGAGQPAPGRQFSTSFISKLLNVDSKTVHSDYLAI
jgi:hypothetical protein